MSFSNSLTPVAADANPLPWFALLIKSRHEKVASDILRGKGYEEYFPVYRSRRVWSDRIMELDLPLFPGYLFCRFDFSLRRPILTTPGVLDVVGFGAAPTPVDPAEIDAIQRMLRSGNGAEPWPYLHAGDIVRVEHGSMAGVEGILVECKKRHRLVVSVTLLQRSVAVEIDRAWVVPVRKSAPAGRPPLHTATTPITPLHA